jgi:hypothetical protein
MRTMLRRRQVATGVHGNEHGVCLYLSLFTASLLPVALYASATAGMVCLLLIAITFLQTFSFMVKFCYGQMHR